MFLSCISKSKTVLTTVCLFALPSAILAQDAAAVLSQASKTMGYDNLKTFQYSLSGYVYSIGQSMIPGGPYPKFTIKKLTRDFDLNTLMLRQDQTITRTDLKGGGLPISVGAEQTQVAYMNRNAAWPAQVFMYLNPPGFMKAATVFPATLTTETRKGKKYNVVTFKVQDKYPVVGLINEQNILERVETKLDNHLVIGDAPLDADFTDYRDYNGIKFPHHILHNMALQPSFEFFTEDFKPNVPVTVEPPPPQGKKGGGGRGGDAQSLPLQKIADGVFFVMGGTHYSVVVDFKDYIAVVDGPLSEARSLAVIAEVKKLIPNKPIRYLINTHHHFDHSNGLRTYAAEGATIITSPGNKVFYEKWWATPRTLAPDSLAKSGKKAVFDTVSGKKVLTDGSRTMEIDVVKGNIHADGMLMVYLPKEKVLIETDLYTPPDGGAEPASGPPPDASMALNLVQNTERLKFEFQTVLSLHGPGPVQKADLYEAAGKSLAN